jgi:hypothetical protein
MSPLNAFLVDESAVEFSTIHQRLLIANADDN